MTDNTDNGDLEEMPLKFDMEALKAIAVSRLQKQGCTSVTKICEGSFNKRSLDHGVCANTHIYSNPGRLPWDNDATNPVGAESILMEKIPGVSLDTVWDKSSYEDKECIVTYVIDIILQLFRTTLDKIGGLYKGNDGAFFIGSIVHNTFFLDGRAHVDMDRGPWLTTRDYLAALLHSEVDYLKSKYGAALSDDGGNGRDEGESNEDYEESTLLLKDSVFSTVIWSRRIMIQGTTISGIIDRESSGACPV
ncbi:MAG: hypothetical protein J3R72DRAFT_525370 [Linnemannia gamsii]|nr:MAG: hypothetical protein J3R72DRAFT_525370 [Linnemannia gamsii]